MATTTMGFPPVIKGIFFGFLIGFLISTAQASELPATVDLQIESATPVLRLYGKDAFDYLGSENANGIAFGDVNGDGLDDMIVGAYAADRESASNPSKVELNNCGEVYVIYGRRTSMGQRLSLRNTNTYLSTTRIRGATAEDSAGFSVASGDINADGYDDILIGALFADRKDLVPPEYDSGEAYVIYGSPSLPGRVINLSDSAVLANTETRILGRKGNIDPTGFFPGDLTGWSVASADVDGDGRDDVIIGARAADPEIGSGTREDAGETWIIYGRNLHVGATYDLRSASDSSRATRILGAVKNSFAGWSVAGGDIDGDGFDDAVIGAYAANVGSVTAPGECYVVYGRSSLPGATIDLAGSPGVNRITRIEGAAERDFLGWSVAAADIDADGLDDLILGAVGMDRLGADNAGGAYVLYGDGLLPANRFSISSPPQNIRTTRIVGALAQDQAGWSVAGGDVNGDGFDDVVIGAIGADTLNREDAGRVYLVDGSRIRHSTVKDLLVPDGVMTIIGEKGSTATSTPDLLGYGAESAADMDGNGFADMAASAVYADNPPTPGNDNDTGAAYVIFGMGDNLTAQVRERIRSGQAPMRGVGGRLSPVARTWVQFDAGITSEASVTLTRSDQPIASLGRGNRRDVADVLWHVESTRSAYSKAWITFRYLDSEIIGLNERGLRLFHASSSQGPWFEVAQQSLDMQRNLIQAGDLSPGQLNSRTFYAITGNPAELPPVIDLDVPLGEESVPLVRIFGDDPGDGLGSDNGNGAAFGDINGDGYDDLILGAPLADRGGLANSGEVTLLYGKVVESPTYTNLDRPAGYYGETRIRGGLADDQLGYSVASGDVNGDGFDDVIIGQPFADPAGRTNSGIVTVLYSGPVFPATLDLTSPTPYGTTRILGGAAGDQAGYSVASGDVNGDGFDDVIIGANAANPPGVTDAGEVYVIYGGTLPAVIDLNTGTGSYSETRILGDDDGDLAGSSVAAGDIDRDGYDDILIGARQADPSGRNDAGAAFVIFGGSIKPGLPALSGSIVDLDTNGLISSASEMRILGQSEGDRLGASIAAGDIDGDGADDVVLGTSKASSGAGSAYVVYGGPGVRGTMVHLGSAAGTYDETRIYGELDEDRAGYSVAAGDINGDGFDEVLLGAILADPPGGINGGKQYLLKGGPGLRKRVIDLGIEAATVTVLGDNESDQYGYASESAADFDRNGFADFAGAALIGDNPFIDPKENNSGYAVAILGSGTSQVTLVREVLHGGPVPQRGIGGRLSPVARAWVGFDAGPAASSQVSVSLTRSNQGISNLGDGTRTDLAAVLWHLSSDRIGFSSATITFQYLDSEIGTLYEPGLRLYHASSPAGPWADVPVQALDTLRNTITCRVSSLGYFAIRLPQEIDVAGGPFDFGQQRFCDAVDSTTFEVVIRNMGRADLVFSSIGFIGPASSEFLIVSPTQNLAANLPPSSTRVLVLAFAPISAGTKEAFLEILSNDPDEPVVLVYLQGEGVDPEIDVNPMVLSFGDQDIDAGPTPPQNLVVRSLGMTDLNFTSVNLVGDASAEFIILSPTAGLADPLVPGASRLLSIAFDPSSLRVREATLEFHSDDCTEPTVEVRLVGTGTGNAPEIRVTPLAVNFGRWDLCAGPTGAQFVKIENIGNLPLAFSGQGILKGGSGGPQFQILSDIPSLISTPILPGEERLVQVVFDPFRRGSHRGNITIFTNDADEPAVNVLLQGIGQEARIEVLPASLELDYGFVDVCEASSTQTVTIRNTGNRALIFTGQQIFIDGPMALDYRIVSPASDVLNTPLPPGRQRNVVVAFDPTEIGLRRARLGIHSDDCDTPAIHLNLYGRGLDPEIDVSPTALNFGLQDIADGPTAVQNVVIRNLGNRDLNFTGSGVDVIGEASAEYFILNPTTELTAPLPAEETRVISVVFDPSSLGIRDATMVITSDDCDEATAEVILSGTGTGTAPEIDVHPKILDFGGWDLCAGPGAARSITIRNIGNLPLVFTGKGIELSGIHGADFRILTPTATLIASPILPGASRQIPVVFDPRATGQRRGRILITTNDADEPTQNVLLLGTGLDPEIAVSTEELDFGFEGVCHASATLTVTLESLGNRPLQFIGNGISISGPAAGDYSILSPTQGLNDSLPVGMTRELVIRFDPSTSGLRRARLVIQSDDCDEGLLRISLYGRGAAPEIEVSPAFIHFGTREMTAGPSAPHNIAILNRGNIDLNFLGAGFAFQGEASAEYHIIAPTSGLTAPLIPGASREITLQFDPSSFGLREASLAFFTDDCDEATASVVLSGTGTGNAPEIRVLPKTVYFESWDVCGGPAPTRSIRIENLGNQPLVFTGIGLEVLGKEANDFDLASPAADLAALPIPPGAWRDVPILFDPTASGPRNAGLYITTNDSDEPLVIIPLGGFGLDPEIDVNPTDLDFGYVDVCQDASRTETFTIRNLGNRALNFQGMGISLEGPAASEFSLHSIPGLLLPLQPGGDREIAITFNPEKGGVRRARLVISSDDCDEGLMRVPLQGRGIGPEIEISKNILEFGSRDLADGPSSAQSVVITNKGNRDLNFLGLGIEVMGEASAEYQIIAPVSGLTTSLPAGQSRQLDLAFDPSSLHHRPGVLVINSDDCDEATATVILSGTGTGTAPELKIEAPNLFFGDWEVCSGQSASRRIVIRNIGNQPLTFNGPGIVRQGLNPADFVILDPTASLVASPILPSQTRSFRVAFDPLTLGRRSTRLRILTNDADESIQDLALVGNGLKPILALDPPQEEVDFGFADICADASSTRTIMVHNLGNSDLRFVGDGYHLTGPAAAEYHILDTTDPLGAGMQRQLVIAFDPSKVGVRRARLEITTNDCDLPAVQMDLIGRGVDPQIEVAPASLVFADRDLGAGPGTPLAIQIRNTGSRELRFVDPIVSLSGAAAGEFNLLTPLSVLSQPLLPGEIRDVSLAFDPSNLYLRTATLTLFSDDCNNAATSILLSGTGTGSYPEIEIFPMNLNYPAREVAAGPSAAKKVWIGNVGTAPLVFSGAGVGVTGPHHGDFKITTSLPPLIGTPIAVGEIREVQIVFDPVNAGPRNAHLAITTNDIDEGLVKVGLAGTGLDSEIEVSPLEIDFGYRNLADGSSAPQTITIRNLGSRDLNFTGGGIVLQGSAASSYSFVSPPDASPLAAGASRQLEVVFTPARDGLLRARIVITTDDRDEPETVVELYGRGLESEIEVTPQLLDFGSRDLAAGASAPQGFLIINHGSIDLNFTGVGIALQGAATGDYRIVSPTETLLDPLSPGLSRLVQVVFDPGSLYPRPAQIEITTDDRDEPSVTVILSGTGTGAAPEIEIFPFVVNFPGREVSAGASPIRRVLIGNIGNQPLTFTAPGLLKYGQHPDDFQFISTIPALTGTPINPGEVREVQMVFDPSSGGGRSARLEITTNDGDEPLLKVDLRGTGFEPEIDVSPLEIDFGYRSLAAGLSATRTVEIRNNGNRVLTLSGAGPVLVGPATAEFVLVNGGGGGVLNPGESRVVTLAFDPSQEGLRRARLQIASDDRDEPLIEVELYGRGTSQPAPIVVPPDQQPEPGHPRSPSNEIPSMIEEWNRYR